MKVGEASLSLAEEAKRSRGRKRRRRNTKKGKDEEEIAPTIQCGITFPNDLIPLAVRLEEVQVWGHRAVWKEQEEIQTA